MQQYPCGSNKMKETIQYILTPKDRKIRKRTYVHTHRNKYYGLERTLVERIMVRLLLLQVLIGEPESR